MSGEGVLPGPRRVRSGLTAADVDIAISADASRTFCCVGAKFSAGFGYDGGGFGAYRLCNACGAVFGKSSAKDGNG